MSYATAVLGHALQAAAFDRSAAVLYALSLGLASVCFTGLWACLAVRPSLVTAAARPQITAALRRSLTGPALYTTAGIVALGSAPASLLIDAAVALYFAVLPRHLRQTYTPSGAAP